MKISRFLFALTLIFSNSLQTAFAKEDCVEVAKKIMTDYWGVPATPLNVNGTRYGHPGFARFSYGNRTTTLKDWNELKNVKPDRYPIEIGRVGAFTTLSKLKYVGQKRTNGMVDVHQERYNAFELTLDEKCDVYQLKFDTGKGFLIIPQMECSGIMLNDAKGTYISDADAFRRKLVERFATRAKLDAEKDALLLDNIASACVVKMTQNSKRSPIAARLPKDLRNAQPRSTGGYSMPAESKKGL